MEKVAVSQPTDTLQARCTVSLRHFRKALGVVSTIYSREKDYLPPHSRTKNKCKKPLITLAFECGVLEIRATDGNTTVAAAVRCEDSSGNFVVTADKYDISSVLNRLRNYDCCILEPFIGFENRQSLRFTIPDDDGGNIMRDNTICADEEAVPPLSQVDGLEFDEIRFTREEARLIANSSLYLLKDVPDSKGGLSGLFFNNLGDGVGHCVASDSVALNCVVFNGKFPPNPLYPHNIVRYDLVKLMKAATDDVVIRFTKRLVQLCTVVAEGVSVLAVSSYIENTYPDYEKLIDKTLQKIIPRLPYNGEKKWGKKWERLRKVHPVLLRALFFHRKKRRGGTTSKKMRKIFFLYVAEKYLRKALVLQGKNRILDVYYKDVLSACAEYIEYITICPQITEVDDCYVVSVIVL